jgi:hypothetical protein
VRAEMGDLEGGIVGGPEEPDVETPGEGEVSTEDDGDYGAEEEGLVVSPSPAFNPSYQFFLRWSAECRVEGAREEK